jgi:hypothetical protein
VHLLKALPAKTLEIKSSSADSCGAFFIPPTNALFSLAGRNRAMISAPPLCAERIA